MYVVTQFNSASLNQHIKNTYHFDNFRGGFVDILAAEQTPDNPNWFQGTADAVRQSLRHLNIQDFDYLLILSGDQLYQMNFLEMAKDHIAKRAELSIATIPVNDKDAPGFGIMKVNQKGMIESFVEKPKPDVLSNWVSPVSKSNKKKGKEYLASMGIYIFNKKTLYNLLENNPEATDFGKEIIPAAIKGGLPVASYEYDGYWTDIGNISSFFDANLELTDNLPDFDLYDTENKIFTRSRMLPPSKFFGTTLKNTIVGEGAIVRAKSIERSIIGVRSRVMDKSTLKNVIMMGADYYEHISDLIKKDRVNMGVGKNCQIERAILDKNCHIGNDVIIKGVEGLPKEETDAYCIIDGIVVVKKGATIPDGARIGAF
jgi:glucose-1-phosphate adenylyltransferase